MRPTISRLSKLAFAIAIVLPASAFGQASPEAEALFRDGKQLMKDGKVAEACQAFEGSEHIEHNIATLLSLADCREKNQQYASAWALFLQADSQTRTDPGKAMVKLNKTAKARALALEPKLSYLTIHVPDASRLPELVVTRDGAPVDPAEWNRSIPADGGVHLIAGKAPGHEPWSRAVTLEPEADKQAVEVPRCKALPEIVRDPVQEDAAPPLPRAAEPSPWTRKRQIGIAMAAGGVVAAGVAIYVGQGARDLRNEAIATCEALACTQAAASEAQDKNDRARTHATIANIGFGVAGVAVAAGAVLWLVGKPEASNAVAMVPQVGETNGLAIMGRF